MSILDASLRKTWDSLRARKQVQNDFLDEVRLKGVRGIRNLREAFDYRMSVIAGRNGWGKSTIARVARGLETEAARGEMAAFSVGLTEQIDGWRQAGAH